VSQSAESTVSALRTIGTPCSSTARQTPRTAFFGERAGVEVDAFDEQVWPRNRSAKAADLTREAAVHECEVEVADGLPLDDEAARKDVVAYDERRARSSSCPSSCSARTTPRTPSWTSATIRHTRQGATHGRRRLRQNWID
jgi:hypothetical protein